MEKIPFTQSGLEKIKTELQQLKNVERQQVIRAIADAREHGDLSGKTLNIMLLGSANRL
ncbi:MAG: hypothetical protein CM15mP117_18700 [Alphaproteobacteria bacterium]|nr:MAG: hypothetical protein CM15mP117_18700 [Alphaproteobacteria bacterium]